LAAVERAPPPRPNPAGDSNPREINQQLALIED